MELTGGIEVRITGGTPLEVLARITAWGLRCCSEPRVYALASQIMELENKLTREIITGYDGVRVEADTENPTVCLVDFSFTVAHGLNQIWVSAHITV